MTLTDLAMKIACTIRPPYRHVAHRIARAVLARDARETLYWLRLARGVAAAPEWLLARALDQRYPAACSSNSSA